MRCSSRAPSPAGAGRVWHSLKLRPARTPSAERRVCASSRRSETTCNPLVGTGPMVSRAVAPGAVATRADTAALRSVSTQRARANVSRATSIPLCTSASSVAGEQSSGSQSEARLRMTTSPARKPELSLRNMKSVSCLWKTPPLSAWRVAYRSRATGSAGDRNHRARADCRATATRT